MNWVKVLLVSFGLVVASPGTAADNPHELIKTTSEALIARLEADKEELKQKPEHVVAIVSQVVLPKIDVNTISRKVLGKHWKAASPEQQSKFTAEFKTYLVRFYAKVFANYDGDKLEMLPPVPSDDPEFATVKTQIRRPDGKLIPVDYRLQKAATGEWKVVDFKAEGVSLVINNQKQYASLVNQEGLDTVIAKLAYKNGQPLL